MQWVSLLLQLFLTRLSPVILRWTKGKGTCGLSVNSLEQDGGSLGRCQMVYIAMSKSSVTSVSAFVNTFLGSRLFDFKSQPNLSQCGVGDSNLHPQLQVHVVEQSEDSCASPSLPPPTPMAHYFTPRSAMLLSTKPQPELGDVSWKPSFTLGPQSLYLDFFSEFMGLSETVLNMK